MKKIFAFLIICLCVSSGIFAQQILTANAFFQSISEVYAGIKDYEASIEITANKTVMAGNVSYKKPNLLRIDFVNPAEQVIVFNGDMLTIYLPGLKATLNQSTTSGGVSAANIATPQGLALMSRYYSIAYETGQAPVLLADTNEQVIRLVLSRKNTVEGFRTITLSILPDSKLIRQVEGITTTNERFVFRFSNYAINQGIPDTRFLYDSPTSANNYNNFLFED